MVTLCFYEPGHFHAALVLRAPNPRIDRSIHVHARPGPDVDRFCELVAGFNDRDHDPTDWDLVVHTDDDPLGRLVADRAGAAVVVAGRNAPKLAAGRRLHDAGCPVLVDKPWITTGAALEHLDRVTAGPPIAMDLMTQRHDVASRLLHRVVTTEEVFGRLADGPGGEPALELDSVHHLCKTVDGRPLTRPEWYYDVRIQGDGLVDIHSHLVDQAQWLIDDSGSDMRLVDARLSSTPVPLSVYTESTGATAFPPSLDDDVTDGVLALACNGRIDYRLGGVRVRQRSEWRTRPPAGGGDTHRAVVRGTEARAVLRSGPETGPIARIHVGSADVDQLADRVRGHLDEWRSDFGDLTVRLSDEGLELFAPPDVHTPHEAHFSAVLGEFVDRVEGGEWSAVAARRIRARYTLLADASDRARHDRALHDRADRR